MSLLMNKQFQIFVSSAILSIIIFLYSKISTQTQTSLIIELTQLYALTTLTYLYAFLLVSPLVYFNLPQSKYFGGIKNPILYCGVFFALLHSGFAFFGELGGFPGLFFLNNSYLLAITLSFISLCILIFITLNLKKLKNLSWLIYPAAFLIVIHALMLGSHFANLSTTFPIIFSSMFAILIILESIRLDKFLNQKYSGLPKPGISFTVVSVFVLAYFLSQFSPVQQGNYLSVHEYHKQLAKQATSDLPDYLKNLPGMSGDRTKRFNVDIEKPENISPNVPAIIRFKVYSASNGAPVNFFSLNYEKLMHLIIVDSSLTSYQHIHPELKNGYFEIPVTFPKEGRFNLYTDFLPVGAIEQQSAFSIIVGNPSKIESPVIDQNPSYERGSENYKVNLEFEKPLLAENLTVGATTVKFKISDKNGNPITTLRPYLGSFGHMIMINAETYDYLHVHPIQSGNLTPDQNGGPEVLFAPVGIYGPIKPGTYKVFAQFNPDGTLITTDFIVKVQ